MGVVIRLGCGASHKSARGVTSALHTLAQRGWHTALVQSGARRVANQLRYGQTAPRPNMHLTISPDLLRKRYYASGNGGYRIGHWQSGQVLPGDWDLSTRDFKSSLKFNACRQHFVNKVPWERTRAIRYGLEKIAEHGKYDSCRSETDLIARYALLDGLWAKTIASNALPAGGSKEMSAHTGILVHVDRKGGLLFGNQGFHRLSIAKLAQVPEITVIVGVVHRSAIETSAYQDLMAQRN